MDLFNIHLPSVIVTDLLKNAGSKAGSWSSQPDSQRVIWLDSLRLLWKKHRQEDRRYGLANFSLVLTVNGMDLVAEYRTIIVCHYDEDGITGYSPPQLAYNPKNSQEGDFASFNNEDFRIFMTGLVLDIIRMTSITSTDSKFMEGLIDFLSPENAG